MSNKDIQIALLFCLTILFLLAVSMEQVLKEKNIKQHLIEEIVENVFTDDEKDFTEAYLNEHSQENQFIQLPNTYNSFQRLLNGFVLCCFQPPELIA